MDLKGLKEITFRVCKDRPRTKFQLSTIKNMQISSVYWTFFKSWFSLSELRNGNEQFDIYLSCSFRHAIIFKWRCNLFMGLVLVPLRVELSFDLVVNTCRNIFWKNVAEAKVVQMWESDTDNKSCKLNPWETLEYFQRSQSSSNDTDR